MIDIIILITCTLCGFTFGKFLEKRAKRKGELYTDLNRYVSLLKLNVEGRQVELSVFDAEFASNCSLTFREYLQNRKLRCSLSSVQKNDLTNFFDNLNCASSQELTNHIEYYSALFGTESKQVSEKEVAKSSIYVKLGILLGVMVGIVLM